MPRNFCVCAPVGRTFTNSCAKSSTGLSAIATICGRRVNARSQQLPFAGCSGSGLPQCEKSFIESLNDRKSMDMKLTQQVHLNVFAGLLLLLSLLSRSYAATAAPSNSEIAKPPPGFTALFNGKDLAAWRGGDTFDHRALLAMSQSERAAKIAEWTKSLTELKDGKPHWRAENGVLVNDGQGRYATTERDYGDF